MRGDVLELLVWQRRCVTALWAALMWAVAVVAVVTWVGTSSWWYLSMLPGYLVTFGIWLRWGWQIRVVNRNTRRLQRPRILP
jgi:hypothetical protein